MLYTNEGKKVIKIPEYGTVYFDDKGIADLLSRKYLIMKGRVVFDSGIQDGFRVHFRTQFM